MGFGDDKPDSDRLFHCDLQLNIVNRLLCNNEVVSIEDTDHWQQFIFTFGQCMATKFEFDVNTKLHRLMRHLGENINNFGCVFRDSSEENKCKHKEFKNCYNQINIYQNNITTAVT